jgi:hypothetical protein
MFLHRTFQEYLTAVALAKREDAIDLADELSLDPQWHEVIVLLGGLYTDQKRLSMLLCDEHPNCVTKELLPRLALAGRVLAETRIDTPEFTHARREMFLVLWGVWTAACEARIEVAYGHVGVAVKSLLIADAGLRCLIGDGVFAARLGPGIADIVLSPLLENLRDEQHPDRGGVAWALGHLGPRAANQVVDQLLSAFGNENFPDRGAVALALGNLGTAADKVVDSLLLALENANFPNRMLVALALGNLGPAVADRTAEPLLAALQDETFPDPLKIVEALEKLGPTVVDKISSHFSTLGKEDVVGHWAIDPFGPALAHLAACGKGGFF